MTPRFDHLKPTDVAHRLAGALDGPTDRIFNADGGRTGQLDALVDMVAHDVLLFDGEKFQFGSARAAPSRTCTESNASGSGLPSWRNHWAWESSSSRHTAESICVMRSKSAGAKASPSQFRSSYSGTMPNRLSRPRACPSIRRTIHPSTRMFSPNPGHRKRPESSFWNQFTQSIGGSVAPAAASRSPRASQWPKYCFMS